jgi:hypothetical protein
MFALLEILMAAYFRATVSRDSAHEPVIIIVD